MDLLYKIICFLHVNKASVKQFQLGMQSWILWVPVQTNMDKRLFSSGIFIDLKKAFETKFYYMS